MPSMVRQALQLVQVLWASARPLDHCGFPVREVLLSQEYVHIVCSMLTGR